jgi:hypothetical protein
MTLLETKPSRGVKWKTVPKFKKDYVWKNFRKPSNMMMMNPTKSVRSTEVE